MRQRLSADERRQQIIGEAQTLFHQQGYGATDMDHIRAACDISRGGLYHHFPHKGAILDAIVDGEVATLTDVVKRAVDPLAALMRVGSIHLGSEPGVVAALHTIDERRLYLSSLDRSLQLHLAPALATALASRVRPPFPAEDAAELFLVVNAHINRQTLLERWTDRRAAEFARSALLAFASTLQPSPELQAVIDQFPSPGQPAGPSQLQGPVEQ